MANYDFKSLSPWEFEQLSRDLLKASLGLDFELFKSGRDQGIDLRYSKIKDNKVIVQCKHYANSTFSNLKSGLKNNEITKIIALSPERYILVTSLGLTPNNKDEIADVLGEYLLSFSDIVTKDTLNGWLNDNPDIEKSNIKLWATTGVVLERIIHSGIFNYTIAQQGFLENKLKYYVKNRSFDEAIIVLKNQRFCIIAGIPGIGKTTLAEMLLIEYMNRGYEPIRITSDIDEAFKVYNPNKLQAFYYDDFLGQTGLEHKLNKNEDQRIVDFCRICAKSSRTIFILTTREYILNQAKSTYEKLDKSGLDINKCVIDISSYVLLDRAKILYNHLHFRDMPDDYVSEVLKDRQYLKIIRHVSFNPRVIEWMTDHIFISEVPANKYVDEFIMRLNRPAMIWEHAYNNQICESTKHLLLVVLTLPNIVLLVDCKNAYEKFRRTFCDDYGESRKYNEFNLALKESEGNFLQINLASGHQTVQFHNPSIRDYLTYFLSSEIELLVMLINSSTSFDQLVSIWNSFEPLENNPFSNDSQLLEIYQNSLAEMIGSPGIRISRYSGGSSSYRYYTVKTSINDQCRFVLTLGMKNISQTLSDKIKEALDTGFNNLNYIYDWSEITTLLGAIKRAQNSFNLDVDYYLGQTLNVLPHSLNQAADYRQLADICNEHHQAFNQLSTQFKTFASNLDANLDDELCYINSVDDIGTLEECADNIERIAEVFKIDLSSRVYQVRQLVADLEDDDAESEEQPVIKTPKKTVTNESEVIASLFETLN